MYHWYQAAERCYVFLTDVVIQAQDAQVPNIDWESAFCKSRWFTRSWTLQELIAPRLVEFYSRDNVRLGDKASLGPLIHRTTRIPPEALYSDALSRFTIEERLCWSDGRHATKEEDMVYSLLGICGVHMPLIYGERQDGARRRLEKEIANSKSANIRWRVPNDTTQNLQISAVESSQEQNPRRPAPFSTVPFPRDRDFIDRANLLEQIHSKMSGSASRVALTGLGGVGKSQLAIEYAFRIGEMSPQTWIFWIHGSTMARFEDGVRATAERLGLIVSNDHRADPLNLFSEWLKDQRNGSWVMIVDNVDDPSVFFESPSGVVHERMATEPTLAPLLKYLPQSLNGRFLFTSRNEDLASRLIGGYHNIIRVGLMSVAECRLLFRQKRIRYDNNEDVDKLLNVIDCFPLAITQAAGYINRAGSRGSVNRYLHLYHQNEESQMSLLRFDGGDLRRDYDAISSVLLIWHVSFEQITRDRPSAADLLALMSFFHWKGIPEFALRAATADWSRQPGHDSSFEFEEDLITLLRFSLVTNISKFDMFEMPWLVQKSMQFWLVIKNKSSDLQEVFLRSLALIQPNGDFETWETCQILFPHVEAAALKQPVAYIALEQWAKLLHGAAWYATEVGRHRLAEQMSRKSLLAWKKLSRNQGIPLIASLGLMGWTLHEQGKYEEAEETIRQAIKGCEKILGDKHSKTLTNLYLLAAVLEKQGKYEEAEEIVRKAVEDCEKALGDRHPDTITSLNILSAALSDRGLYEEAGEAARRGLKAARIVFGDMHLETLAILYTLSKILSQQGHHNDAEETARQVVEGYKETLSDKHPSTLAGFCLLTAVLNEQNKFKEAEEIGWKAVKGCEKALGDKHPDTLTSLKTLLSVLCRQGKNREAEEMARRVLKGFEETFGDRHPDTLVSLNNLAKILYYQGKHEEAEEITRREYKISEEGLGDRHPDTLASLHDLALILRVRGKYKEAERMARQVLIGCEQVLGHGHAHTLDSVDHLAMILQDQGKYKDAQEIRRVYKINKGII